MSASTNTIVCADCCEEVNGLDDTPEQRILCEKCGSTKRNYSVLISESVVIRDGIGLKAKRAGGKKPYIEEMVVPDYSRNLEKVVQRERGIDRDNDRYFEKITDYESGKVIHYCEEPLSQHQGHGNAKNSKGGNNS